MMLNGYKIMAISQLRHNISQIIREAQEGQDLLVLRNNEPVAVIVGYERMQELKEAERKLSNRKKN